MGNVNLLSSLNSQQQLAVKSEASPLVIIAGPGTGKTKTLISRIVYLIENKGTRPENILALTFTKKAASEMQERLNNPQNNSPTITTFHALGYDFLTSMGQELSIINKQEQQEVLTELLQTKFPLFKNIRLGELSLLISRFKNKVDQESADQSLAHLVAAYDELLTSRCLSDYDDLLIKTYRLITKNTRLKTTLQDRYQHILIDEFKDTNHLQYALIKNLLTPNNHLFMIGDPRQSIYAFRGTSDKMFDQVKKDFPDFQEVTLTTNYRSCRQIIDSSAQLFPGSPKLHASRSTTGKVQLIYTPHAFSEADWIIKTINAKIGGTDLIQAGNIQNNQGNCQFSDFAVIYRTHSLSKPLEEKFSQSGIPYQLVGDSSPYEQPEIQLLINVLKYLQNPADQYLKAVLSSPLFQLSSKTLWAVRVIQTDTDYPLEQALKTAVTQKNITQKERKKISQFQQYLQKLTQQNLPSKASQIVAQLTKIFQLAIRYQNKPSVLQNIQQFRNTLVQFDGIPHSLAQAVSYLTYLEKHEFYDPAASKVTLLTMHASKGLEFRYVFICGFEEGIIPLENKIIDMEEEKRLLYVAMTRAKDELYLLATRKRNGQLSAVSRFKQNLLTDLEETNDEAIARIEKKQQKWQEKKNQLTLL